MHHLWAPWRMEYIESSINKEKTSSSECVFCEMLLPENDPNLDRSRLLLHRNKKTMVVMNRYPYNNGHIMVAPKRHVADIEKLDEHELLDLMQSVVAMKKMLKNKLKPHGFNIGLNCGKIAGAGIADHMHFHIVPRWNGDSNFMPVIANTKVIPQALDNLHQILTS